MRALQREVQEERAGGGVVCGDEVRRLLHEEVVAVDSGADEVGGGALLVPQADQLLVVGPRELVDPAPACGEGLVAPSQVCDRVCVSVPCALRCG